MAVRAVFIGVGRHRDQSIHELAGAAKDASVLWALFQDSVDGIRARKLLDRDATAGRMRDALDWAFVRAQPRDTVLAYFSGHGSSGHYLVPFDADMADLGRTGMPMKELAERFASTPARSAIAVLDCCFSGEAPARVAEAPIAARVQSADIRELGGEGRVVLAASRHDQVALEVGGRGLFTSELVKALESGLDWSDTDALMDEVARRVSSKARRIGKVQTPIWAGRIKGGVPFPPVRHGAYCRDESPDTGQVVANPPIRDLAAFGLPAALLDAWAARFSTLNAMQLSAVNQYRVLDGEHLLVIAPTTSGKTFVGELAAARALAAGRKAVFLLPYKAVTNEKHEEFDRLYGQILGMRVVRCTGDYGDQASKVVMGQFDLALLTYEMFLTLSCAFPELLSKIGLVVIDEVQFISDPHRGITVELLITMLRMLRRQGIEPQLVALSAVIGGINRFNDWLGCRVLQSRSRPVPLHEGVIDRTGHFLYLDERGLMCSEQLALGPRRSGRPDWAEPAGLLGSLVAGLVRQGEKVLIFRNSKRGAIESATDLAADLGLPAAKDALKSLPTQDLSEASRVLQVALEGGAAFHTSDLSRDERRIVEAGFRDPRGSIRVLAATSTVAAGVNTPAETVIIVETQYAGPRHLPYSVSTYKNMAGRAGRLGYSPRGRSILVSRGLRSKSSLFDRYVRAEPEAVGSSFRAVDIGTWVLRLLAQVRTVKPDCVADLLANTYGGFLNSKSSPHWPRRMRVQVAAALERLQREDLLRMEGGRVSLTALGLACGRSAFGIDSVLKLVGLLRSATVPSAPAMFMLGLVQALPEADAVYTPLSWRGEGEPKWELLARDRCGAEVARAIADFVPRRTHQARCKRLMLLHEWISGCPMARIEQEFTLDHRAAVRAGNIRGVANLARYLLAGAFEIALALSPDYAPARQGFRELQGRLEAGLPAEALGLLRLPARLDRGSYLALLQHGLTTRYEVAGLDPGHLRQIVGTAAANKVLEPDAVRG